MKTEGTHKRADKQRRLKKFRHKLEHVKVEIFENQKPVVIMVREKITETENKMANNKS